MCIRDRIMKPRLSAVLQWYGSVRSFLAPGYCIRTIENREEMKMNVLDKFKKMWNPPEDEYEYYEDDYEEEMCIRDRFQPQHSNRLR